MNAATTSNERRVSMEGAYNVRDLGGYPTKDGRAVRRGMFYRADGLHKLTADDQKEIVERGVRAIVDLRHGRELEEAANVFASSDRVAYNNVSLINPTQSTSMNIRSLGDLYVDILDNVQPQLLQVFELLAADPEESVLFHCAAGKDRTGVTAALLLDLAGVSRDVIVADYAMTAACLSPLMEELRKGRPDVVSAEMYEKFLGAEPENMEMMLAHLTDRYGGAESYLKTIGLSDETVQVLKSKLVG
ncbi:tyrosine-protein phosphatase [Cohnella soli]|uniref:Tyrosine-protein phosphatase n=1 Tax=Cohnella soli TaxID=425005 RepID=A0ABW0I4D4_9BACL